MNKNIVDRLKKILEEMGYSQEIDEKRSLMAQLSLDSISFVEIIVNIEEEFTLEFDERQLTIEELDTLENIAKLINDRIGEVEIGE